MAGQPDLVCLGVITGAHGVRGEVKIKPFTELPGDVAAYGPVRLGVEGPERRLRLTGQSKAGVVGRLDRVDDRDAAEVLKGTELYVPRARLPQPEADSWYQADLIGLELVNPAGAALGRVVGVHNYGAGDLLEIARPAGGETVLMAFTRDNVPEVRLAEGRLIANPPAGVFDEPPDGEGAS